jgi:NACHT domain
MKIEPRVRIPAVNPLSSILPAGSEGGKEFSRIVDLLLFQQARRAGRTITIFDDSSGDYRGLDSLERGGFRKDGVIGYQYKFYKSPLTDKQRAEIEKSLMKVRSANAELKLEKWILVTPDDLMESTRRKTGGDVAWFDSLARKFETPFECEHWGHTKLLAMFLETRHLCLYYYPELIREGNSHISTLQRIRSDYDANLAALHRRIEFVGMSVYKPEATRGVPMEDIYIPLSVTPEEIAGTTVDAPRIDPLELLSPGTKSVILGDPGSGKSTLSRFLALVGTSGPLQTRYNAEPDQRLPILVVLRRYVDELKTRPNLALLDYIQETTRADFNLRRADNDFFEFYLESGQAILCFDGLDELPNSHYKQVVRDRIRSLLMTFPGNTALVTSRIVGYEEPFRFDTGEFGHFHLTRLRLPEIERFIHDWYRVRIEQSTERDANIEDILRIVRDPEHHAIRELAENPLLLTIVALVHRIDAVLPDERVVLYQKCTETLLNTWYTWKFRNLEVRQRGKAERRNRRRMEAIAIWMHGQSGGTAGKQRAVVQYEQLRDLLANHIEHVEKNIDPAADAVDLAEEFLDFVRKRAGLLIEVGDNQYSFIHLTFQEYLASSGIIAQCERDGIAEVWNVVASNLSDPRWHEVIRLLTAGLKAEESQEFLVAKMLTEDTVGNPSTYSLLLGGLLLDGISAAEARASEVVRRLLDVGRSVSTEDNLASILRVLRTWAAKEPQNQELLSAELAVGLLASTPRAALAGQLLFASLAPSASYAEVVSDRVAQSPDQALLRGFIEGIPVPRMADEEGFRRWISLQETLTVTAPIENFVSAVTHPVTSLAGLETTLRRVLVQQLIAVAYGASGPFHHLHINWFSFHAARGRSDRKQLLDWFEFTDYRFLSVSPPRDSLSFYIDGVALQDIVADMSIITESTLKRVVSGRGRGYDEPFLSEVHLYRKKATRSDEPVPLPPLISSKIVELLAEVLSLEPRAQWAELIRVRFVSGMHTSTSFMDPVRWDTAITSILQNTSSPADRYVGAWLLIVEAWLHVTGHRPIGRHASLSALAEAASSSKDEALMIASVIRNMAAGNGRVPELQAILSNTRDNALVKEAYWVSSGDSAQ